ncbi:type VI secretion system baseplate subunit TssE [Pseudomonas oryzihabitans]|uniref:type VI secretion system baseplate subunit TssE n=1 Tax=Pseudomonas oryzihabitans TaxID=47885 RepID=UPI0028950E99|nr:type VI secretion system baseplate subunit TssE [Pseudomonas oryzihabitans]MDT3717926.1 type VI secretion system baseplate subunit TssE [Pseudomonas oryzihabitans]
MPQGLFDRLAEEGSAGAGLAESVRDELSRLLNTRMASIEQAGTQRTILDYGVADWTAASPHDDDERRRLIREVAAAIRAFEPRLRLVAVTLQPVAPAATALRLVIEGYLPGRHGEAERPFHMDVSENGSASP